MVSITSNELALPTSKKVYVYLDVENGVALSTDYWVGWADTISGYRIPAGSYPFFPAMYMWYENQGNGKWAPAMAIQNALNAAYSSYPFAYTYCNGFWTSQPEKCAYCTATPTLDYTQFTGYQQPQEFGSIAVPMTIWQFAENNPTDGCPAPSPNGCGIQICGGENLDLNDVGSSGAMNYMLVIN